MAVKSLSVPIRIIASVYFEPVPDYAGAETGLVKITFDPAIQGQGWVMLPKEIFSEEFLNRIDWSIALTEIHKERF